MAAALKTNSTTFRYQMKRQDSASSDSDSTIEKRILPMLIKLCSLFLLFTMHFGIIADEYLEAKFESTI